MNLTGKQILSIVAAIVSALMLATTQLTDLFGAPLAHTIVSLAALINMLISSIVAALTGQGSLVCDVAAMPGVERILVNSSANIALAQAATDPMQPKVGAVTPEVRSALVATANGA